MVNKVAAHLALEEGRKEEAVQRFRTFMEHLAQSMEVTADPATGTER